MSIYNAASSVPSSRRPFLHLIVLFGSDPRVMAYSQGVMQQFLSAGVDTWLHCTLSNTNEYPSDKSDDIKPEHLVAVITASCADSLIVIGDRNMKNNTCQARRAGKLFEVAIDTHIRNMLISWSQETSMGLVGFDSHAQPVNGLTETGEAISKKDIFHYLRQYGKAGNVDDRISRLGTMLNELESWSRRAHGPIHRGSDQTMVAKLTKAQTSLIKLHGEIMGMNDAVSSAPVVPDVGSRTEETGGIGSSYSHLVALMGLDRGVEVDGMYRPLPPEAVKRDGGKDTVPPISGDFRERALRRLRAAISEVELLGDRLSAIVRGGNSQQGKGRRGNKGGNKTGEISSLWDHYILEYRNKTKEAGNAGERSESAEGPDRSDPKANKKLTVDDLTADLRQLVEQNICTLEQAIDMLDPGATPEATQGSGDNIEEDWKMSGPAGKKKKKQRKREIEEKERREKGVKARRDAEIAARQQRNLRQQQANKEAQERKKMQQEFQQAQDEQQQAIRMQMELMQLQLQEQIRLQQAAAKQIQMQLERQALQEQQKQQFLQQQQMAAEATAAAEKQRIEMPHSHQSDGNDLGANGRTPASSFSRENPNNLNETFVAANGTNNLNGFDRSVALGGGAIDVPEKQNGNSLTAGMQRLVFEGNPALQMAEHATHDSNGARNRPFDPNLDTSEDVGQYVHGGPGAPVRPSYGQPFSSSDAVSGGTANPTLQNIATNGFFHVEQGGIRSDQGAAVPFPSVIGGIGGLDGSNQFSTMAPVFTPGNFAPLAPSTLSGPPMWSNASVANMMAPESSRDEEPLKGGAPILNVMANEFVPEFGADAAVNQPPEDAPESPPHSSFMKPTNVNTMGNATQWNQYGQW